MDFNIYNKFKFLLIYISILVFNNRSSAQNDNYYIYKGQKIYLQEKTNDYLIKISKDISPGDVKSYLQSAGIMALSDSLYGIEVPKNVFVIRKKTDGDVLHLTANNDNIIYVNKIYTTDGANFLSPKNVIAIKFKSDTHIQIDEFLADLKTHNIDIKSYEQDQYNGSIYFLALSKNNEYNPLKISSQIFTLFDLEFCEPVFYCSVKLCTNDTYYTTHQWGLKNTGQGILDGSSAEEGFDINVEGAWVYTTGCSNLKIAVIDQGVDPNHPDISNNILPGIDAAGNPSNPGGEPYMDEYNIHGTAAAGIIAAESNNGIGIAGIANTSKIIPIRAIWFDINPGIPHYPTDPPTAATDILAYAINWASLTADADIINNSWNGTVQNGLIDAAIDAATQYGRNNKGTLIIQSSGNWGDEVDYPGSNPRIISVGGMSFCGERFSGSSCEQYTADPGRTDLFYTGSAYGEDLHVLAPGYAIPTLDISGPAGLSSVTPHLWYSLDDDYMLFSGTSSAAPHVAGTMALILSGDNTLTRAEATEVLEASCRKLPNYSYNIEPGHDNGLWNNETGYGLIDAQKAVEFAYSTKYYQNQTLENLNEEAVRIFAGYHVTTRKLDGNVSS